MRISVRSVSVRQKDGNSIWARLEAALFGVPREIVQGAGEGKDGKDFFPQIQVSKNGKSIETSPTLKKFCLPSKPDLSA